MTSQYKEHLTYNFLNSKKFDEHEIIFILIINKKRKINILRGINKILVI